MDGAVGETADELGTGVTLGLGATVIEGAAVRLADGAGEALRVGAGLGDGVGDGVGAVSAPDLPKSRPYARISRKTATMAPTQILDTRSSTYGSSSSATATCGDSAPR